MSIHTAVWACSLCFLGLFPSTAYSQLSLFIDRGAKNPLLGTRLNPVHEKIKTEAEQAYQKGDFQKSIQLTSQVIQQNPKDHIALYLRASARMELGQMQYDAEPIREGITDSREAIRLSGTRNLNYYLPYLYGMTNLTTVEGDDKHAKIALTVAGQVLAKKTLKPVDRANFLYQRALIHNALEDYESAIADFLETIRLIPGHSGALIGLPDAYALAGQTEEALAAFKKALESDPENSLIYNNRGLFLQETAKNQEAIADFSRAIEFDEEYIDAYLNRGYVLAETGEFLAAESDYTRAIGLDPEDPSAFSMRADARLKQRKLTEAIDDYKKSIKLQPNDSNLHANLGFCFFLAENFSVANSAFKRALVLSPESRHLETWRHLTLLHSEDIQAAETKFEEIQNKEASNRDWIDHLLLYLTSEISEDELLAAVAEKTSDYRQAQLCEAHFLIAQTHIRNKQLAEAKIHFAKTVESKADYLWAFQAAKWRLKEDKTPTDENAPSDK